jgi:2,3-bisphosphoglycerate-dependent phosphoglycerate mutase
MRLVMQQTLFLIRHAESSGPEPGARLTERGAAQANALANTLAALDIEAVFSSPYQRALATIAPFCARQALPVSVVNGLRERLLSPTPCHDWQHHIAASFTDTAYALPGGESLDTVRARSLQAFAKMASTGHARFAAVSHGNLIASVLHHLNPDFGFDGWRSLRNPDVFELSLLNGQPVAYRRAI